MLSCYLSSERRNEYADLPKNFPKFSRDRAVTASPMIVYASPIGRIALAAENGAVTRLFFVESNRKAASPAVSAGPLRTKPEHAVPDMSPEEDAASPAGEELSLLREAARQLDAYFSGGLTVFSLPLRPAGTDFQRAVWKALLDIPYGRTQSYAGIASALGRPRACRAVGMANSKNPLSIIIPCHRVIGSDGSLTGYAGGLDRKKFLLGLEAARTACLNRRPEEKEPAGLPSPKGRTPGTAAG
jgi:methylated-DNA-[protein]-cysteine S-methyltransferase